MRAPLTAGLIGGLLWGCGGWASAWAQAPPPHAASGAGAGCRIDASAVVPWREWRRMFPLPRHPFVAEYRGCGRALVFLAAAHTNDPASETYAQIEKALARVRPDLVIVEGVAASLGENPLSVQVEALRRKGRPSDGEAFHAVRLALGADVAFQGGEPDEAAVVAAVAARGLAVPDLAGFYVLRQIDQWVREGRITGVTDPRLDARIADFVREVLPQAQAAMGSRAAFAAWYARVNGLPLDAGYRPEDAHPTYPGVERPTNHISNIVADARDAAIVAEVARALETHETVLVVYGGSHHAVQAPAYQAKFGKPAFTGLY